MEAVSLGVFGDAAPAELDRSQRLQLGEALRQIDLERRLHEAETLIREQQKKGAK